MPFFQPPKSGKAKRKTRAYLPQATHILETLLGNYQVHDNLDMEGEDTSTPKDTPTTKGRRTQKLQQGSRVEQPDIGVLLQRQAPSKMAAAEASPAPTLPTPPTQSPALRTEREQNTMLPALKDTEDHTLVTKQDLQQWMKELQDILTADIGTLKADVRQTAERVNAVEENILKLNNGVSHLTDTLHTLKAAHQALAVQVSTQGDRLRRNHIKLRGVPTAITSAELPHFLRRLMSTILSPSASRKYL
ncbi:Hypothetical predicted protein [Pelobates cultripes]|uniref:Uncharacterized protein n=1 Tax=Pelobates cultripes TaxID=61616 RepID=A0AAD1SH98_PELCU|nr:Hypothetical predicted protein [Pelobates cultripes]